MTKVNRRYANGSENSWDKTPRGCVTVFSRISRTLGLVYVETSARQHQIGQQYTQKRENGSMVLR